MHHAQQALFAPVDLPALPAAPTIPATAEATRRWWHLQGRARRTGRGVEPLLVTPRLLARIDTACCPVTREPVGPGTARVVALRDDADYAAGHLVTLGPTAAAPAEATAWSAAWQTAERLATQPGAREQGLDGTHWRRLAVLRSFVQPLTPAQAATLPLVVLPPNRLRVLSPVQGLQVALTLALAAPHRAERLCRLPPLAADDETRQALRVFLLTLLARCPAELCTLDSTARRHALEDLWADPLLARRWARLALRLTDRAAERLLQRGRQEGLLTGAWRALDRASAVDGWALPATRRPESGHDRRARAAVVPQALGMDLLGSGDRRQRADAGAAAAALA
jgi:hypothetical protein